MSAATTDKITDVRNGARPNSARATGTRAAGGTSLNCDNLSGWPDSTKSLVFFVTYKIDSSGAVVLGTQLDCHGIVTGNAISNIVVDDGTDTGNSVGDVVEMLPTAAWGQALADALMKEHSRTGQHHAINNTGGLTTDTATITGNQQVGGNMGVTGTTHLTGATTFTGALGGPGYNLNTIGNSCRFSVYRNAALTPSGSAILACDAVEYDAGSNVDVVTNKGRFTVPLTGYYHFDAQANTGNNRCLIMLYKNGSEWKRGSDTGASAGASNTGILSADARGAAGDYFEIFVNTSSAALVVGGAAFNYFQGRLTSV